MGVRIAVSGKDDKVESAGDKFTGDEIRAVLGCETFEVVSLPSGLLMWMDEDGKGRGRPRNAWASALLQEAGGMSGDFVAGTVLLTTPSEVE
jgi:hypothetical protein